MTRDLNIATLDGAARDYAAHFVLPSRKADHLKLHTSGKLWVLESLFNATFKDEHEYIVGQMMDRFLSPAAKVDFEADAKERFSPREDEVFHRLLKEHLAISPAGDHIDGAIGKVELGNRVVGREARLVRRPIMKPIDPGNPASEWEIVGYREHTRIAKIYWPIYAGEGHERAEGRIRDTVGGRHPGPGADPLPPGAEPLAIGANVTNISAASCIAALDTMTIKLEAGSTAAVIRGRTGAMPADPDDTETGTLLFTLTCTDPTTIAGAVDDTDGTCSATFDSITDDSSADATNTLTYCRFASAGAGADDHIDGNATDDGSGATDWNTLSIVSGSTVSMTSAVLGMSQGSTAT